MLNPASLMKIMSAKSVFEGNHPKFVAFVKAVFSKGMEEGTVIEITVTETGTGGSDSQLLKYSSRIWNCFRN